MPLILPGNVASATAGAYEVANSCRFNQADDPSMTRTLTSDGNVDKFTISMWVKRGKIGVQGYLCGASPGGDNDFHINFESDDTLRFYQNTGGSVVGKLQTNRLFRDCSAWYHLVFVWDTGNATAGNRMRMYVNGTEETSFGTDTQPAEDANSFWMDASEGASGSPMYIGAYDTGSSPVHFDGYIAEFCMCDGQTLAASDFGEFNEDSPTIWQPKDVSGVTFGTNGVYLDFEASDNLGNDANGGTDWSEANLAAADQATDTPTNNFCVLGGGVMNPLGFSGAVISEGNLNIKSDSGDYSSCATMAMTAGKWYWEVKNVSSVAQGRKVGIVRADHISVISSQGFHIGATYDNVMSALNGADGVIYQTHLNGGGKFGTFTDSNVDGGTTLSGTEIVGIALDADNGTIKYFINNTEVNNSPVTLTNWATDFKPFGALPAARGDGGSLKQEWGFNFGGCPPFALSSAAADGNGYGAFEYAPPSGYLALCSKNLGSDGG